MWPSPLSKLPMQAGSLQNEQPPQPVNASRGSWCGRQHTASRPRVVRRLRLQRLTWASGGVRLRLLDDQDGGWAGLMNRGLLVKPTRILLVFVALAMLWTLFGGASPALAFTLNPGDILVSNHSGNNVQRLDPTTGTVTTLTSVSGTPIGLAFDSAGNLYINVNNGIDKLDKATDTLSTFFTGTGIREGLTFDSVTQHLFSVSYGGNAIEEVDLSGHLVRTITIPGTSAPVGIS